MRTEEYQSLFVKDLKHVLQPLKRPRMLKNVVAIGFDSEYTAEPNSAERELLTLQFSLGIGRSKIIDVLSVKGVTSRRLLDYALAFLDESGVERKKMIALVAHYAIAELSKVSDFNDKYEALDKTGRAYMHDADIKKFSKGAIRWQRPFNDHELRLCDLFGHFAMGLEKVGDQLGLKKISLEGIDGLTHHYWITHMKELMLKHRDLYNEYAIRDAEICIEMWNHVNKSYAQFGVDAYQCPTCTPIAMASFRRQMTKLPCKTETQIGLTKQQRKDGTWREHKQKTLVFAGDMNARELACLSYGGGNNQAFARGYFKDVQITQWDFKSLYAIAGIVQPLSNEATVYTPITLDDVKNGYEGFCDVQFRFPADTIYPALPVHENYFDKLMFPLSGRSYCTAAELRQALVLNVEISAFRGYGFKPSSNETDSDFGKFLLQILKDKDDLEKSGKRKSPETALDKAKLVGTVGTLAQKSKFEELCKEWTEKELRSYLHKKARGSVGGSWHIEWASLIVGRARSLAAWAINQGSCLAISTDGGFWLDDPKLNERDEVKTLERYYSGIRKENDIDELWIGRNRCYVAWLNGEVKYIAQGAVAVSGHSSEEKAANFAKIIRDSLNAGHATIDKSEVTRLTRIPDFRQKGIPLNSEEVKIKHVGWKYDLKRQLDTDINVFDGTHTFTKPFDSVDDAFRLEYNITKAQRKVTIGRPTELYEAQIKRIRAASRKVSHETLAERYGVSVSTIRRIRA